MRVIHLYVLTALLIGTLVIVAQSVIANAQSGTQAIAVPQVTTTASPTATPVARSSAWLSVVPDKTTLVAGETVSFQFTITNKYDDVTYRGGSITQAVSINGPAYAFSDTNYTYVQNQCWAFTNSGVTQFPRETGKFRIIAGYVGWDEANKSTPPNCPVGSTIDHPWRWSIGNTPLAAGASRVVTGNVQFTQPGTYTLVFGVVKDFVGYPDVTCDPNADPKLNVCGLESTTITVLAPTATITPSASVTRTVSNTRTTTMTRTLTNTRTSTRTRTVSLTKTLSLTRTPTEVASALRIGRYNFNDALGVNMILKSAVNATYMLTCGGTPSAPAPRCPEIVAGGVGGNALRFAGSHNTSVAQPFTFLGSGTVSFWAKPNATGSEMNVLTLQGNAVAIIVGFDSSGKFFCSFGNNRTTAPTAVTDSNWNHFTCTFNQTLLQRTLYINSELVVSESVVSTPRGLFNGVFGSNATRNGAMYDGDIDEVSLYNFALEGSQIDGLYLYYITDPTRISPTRTATVTRTPTNTPFPIDYLRTNMSARFFFNENSGATSFANAIAATNPATCVAPQICPSAGASGVRFSNAVEFASGQSLKIKSPLTTAATTPFVASTWIYPDTMSNEMVVIAAKSPVQTHKFLLGTTANSEIFCRFGSNDLTSVATIPSNVWSHVLCSIGADKKATLYLNGAPVASSTFTVVPAGLMTIWLGMDGFSTSAPYIGRMDEVAFYRTAMTWEMAEIVYDQYTDVSRRSPTRSRSPSYTRTPSRTRTPSLTRTPSRTPSITLSPTEVTAGWYPYPLPLGTATRTPTLSPSATRTRTNTPLASSPSATSRPFPYPYPTP